MDLADIISKNFPHDSPVHVDVIVNKNTIMIRLTGSLDMDSSSALQDVLASIISQMDRGVRLVVDLGDVSYIPSAGVGALTMALTRAKNRDITFQLCRIQPKVRSVFELLGFMSFFEEAKVDE
jgi:anti-anti-sigma factor